VKEVNKCMFKLMNLARVCLMYYKSRVVSPRRSPVITQYIQTHLHVNTEL